MALDMGFVESQFPAAAARDYVYLDNAGGSLVLRGVADRVSDYLLTSSVQHGASYAKSVEARDRMAEANAAVAKLVNAARVEEVVMGGNTTLLLRMLATAIGETLSPGDEIIVSIGEHEANYGPWLMLERQGVRIVPWPLDADSLLPDPAVLETMMTPRTRLVCVNHVSNILGMINPVREIADVAHRHGARIVVDAVAYAPHRLVDVQALDVDFYAFSFYKTFGPHHAVLYGKYDALLSLPVQNHFFVTPEMIPYKFQPGNVNYELSYGCVAIGEYLEALGRRVDPALEGRPAMAAAFDAIAAHEAALSRRFLDYLATVPGARVWGTASSGVAARVPTISFTVGARDSAEIVKGMDPHDIGIRFGDFHAKRVVEWLGLKPQNGVVRVSMAHYNTLDEIDRLIEKLDPLISRKAA
jgi:cysteine desulfurase family protein (TIGR01976 family)